jgi:hypothetical protein
MAAAASSLSVEAQLAATLEDLAAKAQNAALQARALTERLQHGELRSTNGVSFLEVGGWPGGRARAGAPRG